MTAPIPLNKPDTPKVEPPKDDNPKVSFSKVKGKPLFTVNGTDELVMHDGTKVKFDPALTPTKDEVRDRIAAIVREPQILSSNTPDGTIVTRDYYPQTNQILALLKLQQEALLDRFLLKLVGPKCPDYEEDCTVCHAYKLRLEL